MTASTGAARPISPHWPPALPRHLNVPATNVFFNAEVSAARFPDKPFIVFYDTEISFRELWRRNSRRSGRPRPGFEPMPIDARSAMGESRR